jgi:hypothetical protein
LSYRANAIYDPTWGATSLFWLLSPIDGAEHLVYVSSPAVWFKSVSDNDPWIIVSQDDPSGAYVLEEAHPVSGACASCTVARAPGRKCAPGIGPPDINNYPIAAHEGREGRGVHPADDSLFSIDGISNARITYKMRRRIGAVGFAPTRVVRSGRGRRAVERKNGDGEYWNNA